MNNVHYIIKCIKKILLHLNFNPIKTITTKIFKITHKQNLIIKFQINNLILEKLSSLFDFHYLECELYYIILCNEEVENYLKRYIKYKCIKINTIQNHTIQYRIHIFKIKR